MLKTKIVKVGLLVSVCCVLGLSLLIAPKVEATSSIPACSGVASFSRNLSYGMVGADVKCLQGILNSSRDTIIATAGPGSYGYETTYFGPGTHKAVISSKKNTPARF